MEIKLNLKQLLFLGSWIMAVFVAMFLVTTRPMDALGRVHSFAELLSMFSVTLALFLIGVDILEPVEEN